jgi:hypothetical protein
MDRQLVGEVALLTPEEDELDDLVAEGAFDPVGMPFLRGDAVAAGSLALSALSLAVSWPVLDGAVARVQLARRAAQGLPIRDGEVEFMQTFLPALSVGTLCLVLILLFLSRERPV